MKTNSFVQFTFRQVFQFSLRLMPLISSLCLANLDLYGQDLVEQNHLAETSFSRVYFEGRLNTLQVEGLLTEEELSLYQERYEALLLEPLELNSITVQDLQTIPFITDYQCYQFINYRLAEGGYIQDLSDLKQIEGWDEDFVEYVYPLFYVGRQREKPVGWNELLSEGKSQFTLLSTLPLGRNEREKSYIGSPESLKLKYGWKSHKRISLFIGANKDNYEPWSYRRHRGFESYHAHAMFRDFGRLKQLILGQYRLSWGQGLVLNQGFRSRSIFEPTRGILQNYQATGSTSAYRLSQGLFVGLELSRYVSLSGLASIRRMSARLGEEDEAIYALRESGLNRTIRDWDRRNQVTQRHSGLQLAYERGRWGLSWQGILYDWGGLHLQRAIGAAYSEALQDLKSFANTSLAYRYSSSSGRSYVSGELAMSSNRSLAMMHKLQYQDASWGSIYMGLRYISNNYWAYLGQTDTHFSVPHNEMGIRWGLIPKLPYRGLSVQVEGDWFKSIIPRRAKQHQEGLYLRVNANYKLSKFWNISSRLSYRSNKDEYNKILSSLLLQYRHLGWQTDFRAEYHRSRKHREEALVGYVLSARLAYQIKQATQLWANLSYHQTEDWLNRAYIYEPRLSEQYGSSLLYGRGLRITAGFRARISSHLSLGCNSSLHYRSNLEELRGLLALQMSYKW